MRALFTFVGITFGIYLGYTSARLLAISIAGDDGFFAATIFLTVGLLWLVIGPVCGALCARYFLRIAPGLPRKRQRLLILNLLASMIALIAGMRQITAECAALPADNDLIANFTRHRAAFDAVARMALTEKQVRQITENHPDERALWDTDLTEARLHWYRNQFTAVHLRHGFFKKDGSDQLTFCCWSVMWPFSENGNNQSKGYAYLTTPPATAVSDLDRFSRAKESGITVYRPLAKNWYLYYESDAVTGFE